MEKTGTGAGNVEIKPSIISIGIVDENNNFVSGLSKQFVNLPKEQKYVDGAVIKHIGVLSQKLKCKVKFNKSGSHKFKVKLVQNNNINVVYTNSEKNRNPNFKYQEQELEFTTDGNGEKIIESNNLFVSPAGGDKFKLFAKDEAGKVVQSGEIQNERMMYFVEVRMTGLTTCANSLDVFKNEYTKHGITFQGLPRVSMTYMENIGASDENIFRNNVQTAYNASQGVHRRPYCIAIVYTGHLAVKDANKTILKRRVSVGGATPINIAIQDASKRYALWNNIVTGEDWFVECYFQSVEGNRIRIPKSRCTPVQAPRYPVGYFNSVNINVRGLSAGTGTIVLKVNWVNRMRGGLSFTGTNIIAICTKAWWQTETTQQQNEVIVHEIGHQFEMVPNPNSIYHRRKLLDKGICHYENSKGHTGDHCHAGIPAGQTRYDSSTDKSLSRCVMYGATNGRSDFCSDCAKAIKKMDLSNGV